MLSLETVGLKCIDIQNHFVLAMFLLHIQYIGRADNRCFAGYIPVSDVAQTTNRAGIAATDGGCTDRAGQRRQRAPAGDPLRSLRTNTSGTVIAPSVAVEDDVEDVPVRGPHEEPAHPPRLGRQRMNYLVASLPSLLVGTLDVISVNRYD